MPSPFPGMDPYIEAQEWGDFHTTFNTIVRELLTPALGERYFIRVERRLYVEHESDDSDDSNLRVSDVAVVADRLSEPGGRTLVDSHAAAEPHTCILAIPEERREAYLVIREREEHSVVTVIETLSPANKRRGGDGWRAYQEKREQVLRSQSHLVELDLLRRGARMPLDVRPSPPPFDYYALVSRAERRPKADVYCWSLLERMPVIPIPLLEDDPDLQLDLHEAVSVVYERAAYQRSLDYSAELTPPLPQEARAHLPSVQQ